MNIAATWKPELPYSRRTWLARSTRGMLAIGSSLWLPRSHGDEPRATYASGSADGLRMIVRSDRPLNLESPVSALDAWLTPVDQFFVRSHFGAPATGLHPWQLEIAGLVDRPVRISLDELAHQSQVTVPAVLQCAGNGRLLFGTPIPGVGWERGAVGHAEWSGVPLANLLQAAGVQSGASHVHMIGGDAPPSPKTPAFVRSIPLSRALDQNTLIALQMNGQPLPPLHGGPLRLIVPGWAGNNWTKWVRRIVVSREEAPGFYMQAGYRLPKVPIKPGDPPPPATELKPVTWMNVKSLVTSPPHGDRLTPGRHEVRGVAWTGEGHVTTVEFSTDRDPVWRAARLIDPPRQGSWRRFRFAWDSQGLGRHLLKVRATDSKGQIQPVKTPWNKSGYLWNGIDAVACDIV